MGHKRNNIKYKRLKGKKCHSETQKSLGPIVNLFVKYLNTGVSSGASHYPTLKEKEKTPILIPVLSSLIHP